MQIKTTVKELKEALPNISDDNLRLNTTDELSEGAIFCTGEQARMLKRAGLIQPSKKRSKYNAIPTTYNGIVYHSKKEAQFAEKLDMTLKAHEIDYVLRQVPFSLPGEDKYVADFVTLRSKVINIEVATMNPTVLWIITVYEVKGMWTPLAKNKNKRFKLAYPLINLEIV